MTQGGLSGIVSGVPGIVEGGVSDGGRVMLMSGMRLLVGLANVFGAYLMYRSMSVRTSTSINAVFGSVLPIVFMIIMAIGISGLAFKVPPYKLAFLVVGTGLIIWGTR